MALKAPDSAALRQQIQGRRPCNGCNASQSLHMTWCLELQLKHSQDIVEAGRDKAGFE